MCNMACKVAKSIGIALLANWGVNIRTMSRLSDSEDGQYP